MAAVKDGIVYDGAMDVLTLIEEAIAAATGNKVKLTHPFPNHCWEIKVNGTITGLSVILEGSLDGTNFYEIDSATSTNSVMRWKPGRHAKYIRARIETLTGVSTSPVCNITIRYLPAIK